MEEHNRIHLSSLTDEITEEESTDEDEISTEEEEDDGDPGPPIHYTEDQASPPEWILLGVHGYVAARKNATTAYACRSKGGGAIRVTFWPARPPRVACFTVHCDGVESNQFHRPPMVLAAADDLVLLHIGLPPHDPFSASRIIECYIYQAAAGTPTLRLLTIPCNHFQTGILRLRGRDDGEFLVAAIESVVGTNGGAEYDLHLFDSRTWTWTTRLMRVDKPERYALSVFRPTKVLTIGGERGSMAWVDLWQGILICDLFALSDDAMLRYIPLPPSPSTTPEGSPSNVRDIAVVQGRIKFFEMRFRVKQRTITSTTTLVTKYMKATAWETTDPWQNWRRDCGLDIFKVPVDKAHPELPPRLHDIGKLHGEHPALSLHEEDVVYIMAKAEGSDQRAWMLAIDVRNKTLREVPAFDADRGRVYNSPYIQSGMSSYLRIQSSAR